MHIHIHTFPQSHLYVGIFFLCALLSQLQSVQRAVAFLFFLDLVTKFVTQPIACDKEVVHTLLGGFEIGNKSFLAFCAFRPFSKALALTCFAERQE